MRRASVYLALLGLVVLGLPAVAAAEEIPTPVFKVFEARFVPLPKPGGGTYAETGNIYDAEAALELDYEFEGSGYGDSAQNPSGGIPPLSALNFFLPADARADTEPFPTCDTEMLENIGPSGCPAGSAASTIGSVLGEATAGPNRVPEEATLQGFFAPGGGLVFFIKGASPMAPKILSSGIFINAAGRYSKEFKALVPPGEPLPHAPLASVKAIKVEIGAAVEVKRKGEGDAERLLSFLRVPRDCPQGGFRFKTEVTFGGEEPGAREFGIPAKTVTAEYRAPCPTRWLGKSFVPGTGGIVIAPKNKMCVSPGEFPIHVLGVDREVSVYVNGHRANLVHRGYRESVRLSELPKGRFTLRFTVITATGRRIMGIRAYHTCAR